MTYYNLQKNKYKTIYKFKILFQRLHTNIIFQIYTIYKIG